MAGIIRVEWEPRSLFFLLVLDLIGQASRRWNGERHEALGYVWQTLRLIYFVGDIFELRDTPRLRKIVQRKVSNFYRQERSHRTPDGPTFCERSNGLSSTRPAGDPPEVEVANRELSAMIDAALNRLGPSRGEAARAVLKHAEAPSVAELARGWGTTPQNVYKHGKKAAEQLRKSLAGFA